MIVDFKVKYTIFGVEQLQTVMSTNEKGEPIQIQEPMYLHKTLANFLGMNPHKETGIGYMDALKWASLINEGKPIDIGANEAELLKKFIESSDFTAFAKKCLLECFDEKL